MNQRVLKLLHDALKFSEAVSRFIVGKTSDDYFVDEVLRSAVERQLIGLGEALSSVRNVQPDVGEVLMSLNQIVGMRNRIVHDYNDVSNELIWTIASEFVPKLEVEIREILEKYGDQPE